MSTTKIDDLKKRKYLANIKLISNLGHGKSPAYIYLFATFLSLSLLIVLAIGPTLGTITELQKKLEDSKIADEALDLKIKNMNSLQQQYAQIATDLPLIQNALPNEPAVTSLFGRIQAVAKSGNVVVTTLSSAEISLLSTTATPDVTSDSSFAFSVTVNGDYASIVRFLESISNFDRIITVNSLSISRDTTSENTTNLRTMSLDGVAYYQK